jgi:hypothetical protein
MSRHVRTRRRSGTWRGTRGASRIRPVVVRVGGGLCDVDEGAGDGEGNVGWDEVAELLFELFRDAGEGWALFEIKVKTKTG